MDFNTFRNNFVGGDAYPLVMKMQKKILFLILGIFLINLAQATVTCNPSSFITNFNYSNPTNLSTYCTNNDINNSVTISTSGETSLFSINDNIIGYGSSKTIAVSFNLNSPVGLHTGTITFSDGSSIPVFFNVIQQQEPTQSGVIIFPTAKVINIQQGTTKSQNIQIIVPQNYPRTITIQDVSFNPDTDVVRFGDLNLGQLSPSQTLNIPLIIDGNNVQVGYYDTQVTILATDSQGQIPLSSVSLRITVTSGVSSGNGTLVKPDCSLSSLDIPINSSATLTCSNVVSSIDPFPLYSEYIEGTSADLTSNGIYTYNFKPIKIGIFNFTTIFLKSGSPIFAPFTKSMRISQSGSTLAGTALDISFYQNNLKKELSELLPGDTSILIRDASTQNIVSSFIAYLNGKIINSSFNLEANKPYELIIDSSSYISKTINFTLNPQYITISLNPSSGWVEGAPIYYNTTPENSSLFLDGIKLINNNFVPSSGNHTLEAILDGYINTKLNITILESVRIITPIIEWKKGTQQSMLLSKSASWQINYAKDLASQYNPISSGVGENITFTPEKSGLYQVVADGKIVDTKEIKGWNWGKKWWFMAWYWWILLGSGLIVAVIFLVRRNSIGINSNLGEGGFKMQGVGGGE